VCSRAARRDESRDSGRGSWLSVASLSGFVARDTQSVLSEWVFFRELASLTQG